MTRLGLCLLAAAALVSAGCRDTRKTVSTTVPAGTATVAPGTPAAGDRGPMPREVTSAPAPKE